MPGRRFGSAFALLVLVIVFLAGAVRAGHMPFATGQAQEHPVNGSGVRGVISFTASGAGVSVTGTASGLQPSIGRYVSLVYDKGSVPGGPVACEPTVELDGMFVGIWAVDALGHGVLIQLNPAVASLSLIDSVSIRDTTINGGFGPAAVVACGQIAVHPASP